MNIFSVVKELRYHSEEPQKKEDENQEKPKYKK